VWHYCQVVGDLDESTILVPHATFYKTQFFRDSRVNYAENLLKQKGKQDAIVFWGENQIKRHLSFDQLLQEVAQVSQALRGLGIQEGDRVVGYMPNLPETVVAMLATASLGAIWSSCSPDFGIQGVVDRFGQIKPKALFVADGYFFKGQAIEMGEKIKDCTARLPTLEHIVIVPYIQAQMKEIPKTIRYHDFIHHQSTELNFTRVPFNHPLFIMFSSGTTGLPKCLVHGHGGTLIQHLKEHQLHCDIRSGDRLFYFTTCGWMMWNWLVSGLASEGTLLLYDGHPAYPNWNILFDLAEQESATFFGVSAKYIDALRKEDLQPIMTSTGSPLLPENFDYVYQSISPRVHLASISGGTDIISCFALGNPIQPVWRGELQTRGLGLRVEVFDEQGQSVQQQKGELVCAAPFPCMPVRFWQDPNDQKYQDAYFNRFPNIWCHGDFVELTSHQGLIIYGRSDTTLNPGGVRIGTAEIYRQVAQRPEIAESIVVGQEWQADVRVILFVKLSVGHKLTDQLKNQVKEDIRVNVSPRHVPDLIVEVPDIPRTFNGKISEKAVADVLHKREVKNKESLENPEALNHFMAAVAPE
jgi:acetoacetyl-CoA synthetase